MRGINRKYQVLAGMFGVMAFIGLAYAGVTTYTSLKITGTTALQGVTTISGATTHSAAVTVTGATTLSTTTFSGAQSLAFPASFITLGTDVARSTGTVGFTSTWVMYVATGTGNANQWVKIGGQ
jgi:hypothetical protein